MTTPKDNALHLMEGQGEPFNEDDPYYNLLGVIADAKAGNFNAVCVETLERVAATLAAPKTSFAHWVDEVEASGEAEKHAMSDALLSDGLMALLECAASDLESYSPALLEGYEADVCRVHEATSMGLRAELAAANYELNKFKELYRLSQEGLVRERGITKEQGEHIKELAGAMEGAGEMLNEAYEHWDADREMKVGKILLALLDYKIRYDKRSDAWHAALSKVQHVAARGAEVSE